MRVTTQDGFRWLISNATTLPANALTRSLSPMIDGFLIQVHAADNSSGFIASDTTVCTVSPCTQTNDFTALDTAIATLVGLTCGNLLHNNAGHSCYVNFELGAMSNGNTFNKDTPAWVYSQPWATTVGSSVQDALFCSSVPQDGTASPAPPASAVANLTSNNCGAGVACTPATLSGGMAVPWEAPFAAFQKGWLLQFFQHLATVSYLANVKYFSVSIGVGTENGFICETQAGVAGTLAESVVAPATDAGLKTAFINGLTSYFAYAASVSQSLNLPFALIARFSMANTLTAATATDPTWATSEVAIAIPYANVAGGVGVGSNGWKNYSGTNGSDLINIVGAGAGCVVGNSPACTSNNWSKAIASIIGKGFKYIIAQNCNNSDPGGALAHCDDALASGTGTQADSLWQWFSLAGFAGVNVIELGQKDIQCIANLTPLSPCASGNAIQLAYAGAAIAWARGYIPINH